LGWYFFILFFSYPWGTSDKKWGTLNTLSPGQSKQGKAWEAMLECSTENSNQ